LRHEWHELCAKRSVDRTNECAQETNGKVSLDGSVTARKTADQQRAQASKRMR
jgi:hypothetical protein